MSFRPAPESSAPACLFFIIQFRRSIIKMEYCSIASGSSGNCTFIGTDHTSVLIDAGITGKRITEGICGLDRKPDELDAILVTHEHSDHIRSLGVLARKYGIPIYATQGTIHWIYSSSSMGKLDYSLFHEIRPDEPFFIKDLEVEAFRISHDAADPVGYRLKGDGTSFAVATDMGCYDDYIVSHLSGLDGILLESNHDENMLQAGPYPYPLKQRILGENGHLSNVVAGRLLCEILHDRMQSITLGHLSKENNYEALAFATVTCEITMGDNPYHGDDFPVTVASRDHPMDKIILKRIAS